MTVTEPHLSWLSRIVTYVIVRVIWSLIPYLRRILYEVLATIDGLCPLQLHTLSKL